MTYGLICDGGGMRKTELEAWVLSIIDRVELAQPHEDARVELKREWPEPKKAARRIAGHANAAGGDLILWIVGVDEKTGVVGAAEMNVADWYSQVKAEFNQLAPELSLDLNVPMKDGAVVALLFETDRAPYVVKNPAYGVEAGVSAGLEVPWREGTAVRSATRSELLRILSPLQELPDFEVLEGSLKMKLPEEVGAQRPSWHLILKLYISPKTVPVTIPYHRCRGTVRIEKSGIEALLSKVSIYRHGKLFGLHSRRSPELKNIGSITIQESYSELIINGPGMLQLEASSQSADLIDHLPLDPARVSIEIFPADADRPSVFHADFIYFVTKDKEYEWTLSRAQAPT
jgi:hypothetical protein